MRHVVLAIFVLAGLLLEPGATRAQGAPCLRIVAPPGYTIDGRNCFAQGEWVRIPPGTGPVTLQTPGGDTFERMGNDAFEVKAEALGPGGQSFWAQGWARVKVVSGNLGFFTVRGQQKGKRVETRTIGTVFDIRVDDRNASIHPIEGQIRVTSDVRLGLTETARPSGQRQSEDPARYFARSELVTPESGDYSYSFDEDVYFDGISNYRQCVDYFQGQLDYLLRSYPNEFDPDIATGYVNVGDCHLAGDQPGPAIAAFSEALRIDRALFGDYDPDVAEDFRGLGEAYLVAGDTQTALSLFMNALAIDRFLFGDYDTDVLWDLELLIDAHSEAAWQADENDASELADQHDAQASSYEQWANAIAAELGD